MITAVEEDTTTTASTGLRPCSAVLLTMDIWQNQAVRRNMTSSRRDSPCLIDVHTGYWIGASDFYVEGQWQWATG